MRELGGYQLDDDRARVDVDVLWRFLSTEAYWARFRTRADIEGQVASAWRVVGAYDADGRQVAFARSWSDGVTSAYLGDVFVLPEHRGRGLGVAVVEEMIENGPGAGLRWLLHTADAHTLYRRFGFAPPDGSFLEKPRPPQHADSWEIDVAAVWRDAAQLGEAGVVAQIEALAEQRPGGPDATFELACAYDFAGREPEAEPAYRSAMAAGLDDDRNVRARLQLASTLRNLGRPDEALQLLADDVPQRYVEARAAFRTLALLDAGRAREAALEALDALAGRLPVYGRAIESYAGELREAVNGS